MKHMKLKAQIELVASRHSSKRPCYSAGVVPGTNNKPVQTLLMQKQNEFCMNVAVQDCPSSALEGF